MCSKHTKPVLRPVRVSHRKSPGNSDRNPTRALYQLPGAAIHVRVEGQVFLGQCDLHRPLCSTARGLKIGLVLFVHFAKHLSYPAKNLRSMSTCGKQAKYY